MGEDDDTQSWEASLDGIPTKGRGSDHRPNALRRPTQRGVSDRVQIYNLIGSELWLNMIMVQKLLWAKMSHCLGTLSVDKGVPPLLLCCLRGVHDWGHCTPGNMWWSAPNQNAHVTTAVVRFKRCKKKGTKEPAAAMLEALVFIRAVVPVSPRDEDVRVGLSLHGHTAETWPLSCSGRVSEAADRHNACGAYPHLPRCLHSPVPQCAELPGETVSSLNLAITAFHHVQPS